MCKRWRYVVVITNLVLLEHILRVLHHRVLSGKFQGIIYGLGHHPTDPQIILPSNYNLAITFSGWGASQSNLFGILPDSYPLASSQSGHNYISIGGGADIGAWNSNDLDPSLW